MQWSQRRTSTGVDDSSLAESVDTVRIVPKHVQSGKYSSSVKDNII